MTLSTLSSYLDSKPDLEGKVALLRVDINVPMKHEDVIDDTRIERIIPTIHALTWAGAKVVVISHFGRPKGHYRTDMSLAPLADKLTMMLDRPVKFGVDVIGGAAKRAVDSLEDRGVLLLENLRFHAGEEDGDDAFAKQIADLGDFYVNDAFSCSHRAHASITGITKYLPSYAGLSMENEVTNLESLLGDIEKPSVAIVGGSKVSTKIELLERLVTQMDTVLVGGGMANTFLYAQGKEVGLSLHEPDQKALALDILKLAEESGCKLLAPSDAVVAEKLAENQPTKVVSTDAVPADRMMLDIGPETIDEWQQIIKSAKTLLWNGPLGAYEITPFNVGSISIARKVADLTEKGTLKSVAGGGDVVATLSQAGLDESFTYISTAGGAFLEWLEGKELPGVKVLQVAGESAVASA